MNQRVVKVVEHVLSGPVNEEFTRRQLPDAVLTGVAWSELYGAS